MAKLYSSFFLECQTSLLSLLEVGLTKGNISEGSAHLTTQRERGRGRYEKREKGEESERERG